MSMNPTLNMTSGLISSSTSSMWATTTQQSLAFTRSLPASSFTLCSRLSRHTRNSCLGLGGMQSSISVSKRSGTGTLLGNCSGGSGICGKAVVMQALGLAFTTAPSGSATHTVRTAGPWLNAAAVIRLPLNSSTVISGGLVTDYRGSVYIGGGLISDGGDPSQFAFCIMYTGGGLISDGGDPSQFAFCTMEERFCA